MKLAVLIAAAVLAGCGGASRSLSEQAQLFVVGRAGGGARQLTKDAHARLALAWSPDGTRLATSYRSGIEVYSSGGRRLRTFRIVGASEGALSWSPNGRFLAFGSEYENHATGALDARLVALTLRSGARRAVAQRLSGRPAWMPDSRSLVYMRADVVPDSGGPPDAIWRTSVDARRSRPLVARPSADYDIQLSRDGRRLVFARNGAGNAVEIWTARADGGGQRLVVQDDGGVTRFAWTPDDRGVFVVDTASPAHAYVVSETGRRRQLSRMVASDPVAWSPDGRLIAWARWGESATTIDVARPDGSAHRVLARLPGRTQVNEMSWSPDGRRLALIAEKTPRED